MKLRIATLALAASGALLAACPPPSNSASAQAQTGPAQTGYPRQPYPQTYPTTYPTQPAQPYPPPYPQPYPTQPQPQPQPQPQVQPQRPLLAPLVGSAAMQQEVRAILAELIAVLGASNQQRVRGIPLVFDPSLEVNAYAGCDEKGAPFLAGTEGLLQAVDAIAQTKATDEMFGTQTYETYCSTVIPSILKSDKASPGLPAGLIPQNLGPDARRWSRAREIFQDVVAFTFGHELAHHYLGHTGCANGQPIVPGPNPAMLGNLLNNVLPFTNQPNEAASDAAGTINGLDAGIARRPSYRWSERGGLLLLEFFARLERQAGVNPLSPIVFLQSHPNPQLRIPVVRDVVARNWYAQHPQVNPQSN